MISKTDIVEHAHGHTLHRFVVENYERRSQDDDAGLVALAVKLHNDGEIDLLAALANADIASVGAHSFFTLQQFYCAAIPQIEADALAMMIAVSNLIEAGGQDLMSHAPNGAYRDWCSKDQARVERVLALIDNGNTQAKDYLSLTLEAGANLDLQGYLARTLRYMRDTPEFRLGALTALSRIDSSSAPDLIADALSALNTLVGQPSDDALHTHILAASVGLFIRAPTLTHDAVLALMEASIEQRGDGVLHHAASMLFNHRSIFSEAMIDLLLNALESIDPKNRGTIDSLDAALSELIKSGRGKRVSAFLETVVETNADQIEMKQFDSVSYTLRGDHQALGQDMAVRWLLSGNTALASSVAGFVNDAGDASAAFAVDLDEYALSDTELLFLARKAVGWFFFQPITAASLIICILRTAKGDVAEEVGNLLFEPLLLNYSGELREYLESKLKGPRDKAKSQIRRAVGKLDTYLADLRETGFIAELAPSERERLIEQQRHNESMRQIQKQAEESSVLMSLVSKSVLLHGNGSISYRRDPSGKLHRHVMKMGSFSTRWEAPRLQTIDPFGLDMQLRAFRVERLAS